MSPARKDPDMGTYSGRIAARMRKFRIAKKLKVADIAETMEKHGYPMAESAYRHWENGTRPQHVDALPAIAKSLGVKLDELLPKR